MKLSYSNYLERVFIFLTRRQTKILFKQQDKKRLEQLEKWMQKKRKEIKDRHDIKDDGDDWAY